MIIENDLGGKLQSCDFKKKQYQRILSQLNM